MKKILLSLIISLFVFTGVYAGVNLPDEGHNIRDASLNSSSFTSGNGDIVDNVESLGMSILNTVKVIFEGVLLIYIVYIGVTLILSMGTNEDDLSKSKRAIRYSMIGLVFINVPGTLYYIFKREENINDDISSGGTTWTGDTGDGNFLVNLTNGENFMSNIIGFIGIAISALAILMIVIEGIKIMTSRGREEKITQAKNRILWSLIGLVFIAFIQAWKSLVFTGDIGEGGNLFETMTNLALFFAGPTAIAFLTLAAYYYITANGDEERAKKAKSIVVNTLIATVLLLASYTFLLDLFDLNL